MSAPPRLIAPRLASSSPDSRLMSVDLPAPLGPITAWISPTATSIETSDTATRPPKCLCRLVARNAGSDMRGLRGGLLRFTTARRRPKNHRPDLLHAMGQRHH